jgi:DNA-binding LytR/AlgR family response regulator
MKTRALIAEDEPVLAQALGAALERLWPELEIDTATNGNSAVEQALARRPDLLFLDIKMPGQSGLEAAQELAEEWPEEVPFPLVVFVTAYDAFALQAFEHAAADYILKPVSDTRLATTVARLKARLAQQGDTGRELARVLEQLRALGPRAAPSTERLSFVRAAVGTQIRIIPIAEVLYFRASDKYLSVVTAGGEFLIRTSLKDLLPRLDSERFWQIHRGTVVNAAFIQAAVRDETGKLTLRLHGTQHKLAVSRVFVHLFRQM